MLQVDQTSSLVRIRGGLVEHHRQYAAAAAATLLAFDAVRRAAGQRAEDAAAHRERTTCTARSGAVLTDQIEELLQIALLAAHLELLEAIQELAVLLLVLGLLELVQIVLDLLLLGDQLGAALLQQQLETLSFGDRQIDQSLLQLSLDARELVLIFVCRCEVRDALLRLTVQTTHQHLHLVVMQRLQSVQLLVLRVHHRLLQGGEKLKRKREKWKIISVIRRFWL